MVSINLSLLALLILISLLEVINSASEITQLSAPPLAALIPCSLHVDTAQGGNASVILVCVCT
jgi:hypothetical protein